MGVLRLSPQGDAPHQPRRELLEAVQGVGARHPHSHIEQAHAALSQRVRFPIEPSEDAERDV